MAYYVEEGMSLSLEGDEEAIHAQDVVEGECLWKGNLLVLYGSLLMHALVALKSFLDIFHDGVFGSCSLQHHQHLKFRRMSSVRMQSM